MENKSLTSDIDEQLSEKITQSTVEIDQLKQKIKDEEKRAETKRRRKKYWMWVRNK